MNRCLFSNNPPDAFTFTGKAFSFAGLADYLQAADFNPAVDNGFILPPTRENPNGVFVHGFEFALAVWHRANANNWPLHHGTPAQNAHDADCLRLWRLFGGDIAPARTWPINSLAYRVHLAMSVCPFEGYPKERRPE